MSERKSRTKTRPHRPIMGGTNEGERPTNFSYWRVGYGGRERFRLDFWVEQAGEFHCKPGYITAGHDTGGLTHIFYQLEGEGVFESTQRSIPISFGDLLIVPPEQPFHYGSQQSIKYHWVSLAGQWPPILGASPSMKRLNFKRDMREMEEKFTDIREVLILNKPGYPLKAVGILYDLMARIEENSQANTTSQSPYPETIRRAMIYLRENIAYPFNAAETAAAVNVSQSHLRALFEKWVGESPKQYHTRCRIDQAKRFLVEQNLSISNAALRVGFTDVRHFMRVFKQYTELTPSQYLKERQG